MKRTFWPSSLRPQDSLCFHLVVYGFLFVGRPCDAQKCGDPDFKSEIKETDPAGTTIVSATGPGKWQSSWDKTVSHVLEFYIVEKTANFSFTMSIRKPLDLEEIYKETGSNLAGAPLMLYLNCSAGGSLYREFRLWIMPVNEFPPEFTGHILSNREDDNTSSPFANLAQLKVFVDRDLEPPSDETKMVFRVNLLSSSNHPPCENGRGVYTVAHQGDVSQTMILDYDTGPRLYCLNITAEDIYSIHGDGDMSSYSDLDGDPVTLDVAAGSSPEYESMYEIMYTLQGKYQIKLIPKAFANVRSKLVFLVLRVRDDSQLNKSLWRSCKTLSGYAIMRIRVEGAACDRLATQAATEGKSTRSLNGIIAVMVGVLCLAIITLVSILALLKQESLTLKVPPPSPVSPPSSELTDSVKVNRPASDTVAMVKKETQQGAGTDDVKISKSSNV